MAGQIDRRDFLRSLGVGAGVTLGAAAGSIPLIGMAQAQEKPKGNIHIITRIGQRLADDQDPT